MIEYDIQFVWGMGIGFVIGVTITSYYAKYYYNKWRNEEKQGGGGE